MIWPYPEEGLESDPTNTHSGFSVAQATRTARAARPAVQGHDRGCGRESLAERSARRDGGASQFGKGARGGGQVWRGLGDRFGYDGGFRERDPGQARGCGGRGRGCCARCADGQHIVYTGLALLDAQRGREAGAIAATTVWMRRYSDQEISAYIASGDPLDKAGAYGIQNASFHPVERIEGCYSSVMGFPLCHLYGLLASWGRAPAETPVRACLASTGFACRVHRGILNEEAVHFQKRGVLLTRRLFWNTTCGEQLRTGAAAESRWAWPCR